MNIYIYFHLVTEFHHKLHEHFCCCQLVAFVFAYLISNIALALKEEEIFFQSLAENLLEFYLLLSGIYFFDRIDKQIQFWQQSISPQ